MHIHKYRGGVSALHHNLNKSQFKILRLDIKEDIFRLSMKFTLGNIGGSCCMEMLLSLINMN